jgi:hypothetical protein
MANIYQVRQLMYGPSVGSTTDSGTNYTTLPTTDDVTGFTHSWGEDFDTNVSEGGFYPVSSGSDLGLLDPGCPGASYRTSWKVKANGTTGESSGCQYNASKTTSVASSVWKCRMHYESGVPYSGAIKPLLPGANSVDQLYGRYIYRARLTGDDAAWGTVFDMINPNTWSTGTGEYGHPECNHTTGPHGSWIHPATLGYQAFNSNYKQRVNYTQFALGSWHTYEIRWQPGRMRLYVDGTTVYDVTTMVPATNLGFVIQCGAPGTPGSSSTALIEIDWISIYTYTG